MAETLLAAEGLTKRFGGVYANRDVSFSVGRGEIVGLIGPNGAGKMERLQVPDRSWSTRADAGNLGAVRWF